MDRDRDRWALRPSELDQVAEVLFGDRPWAAVQADCLEAMQLLPNGVIDHTLTDPPYSADLYSRTRTNKGRGVRKTGTPYAVTEGAPSTSALQLASRSIGSIDSILEPVAEELLRLTSRWMVVFSDCEIAHRWQQSLGDSYVRTGAWVKTDPMPQVTGDRPGQGFEPATIGHGRPRGRMRWNGGGHAAVWIHGTAKGHNRPDHPCPKPLALMLELVGLFTDPGDVVLDPFCGSGTTGVACVRLGRRFIGIERDKKYAALSRERLNAEGRGQSVPEFRSGQAPLFADWTAA